MNIRKMLEDLVDAQDTKNVEKVVLIINTIKYYLESETDQTFVIDSKSGIAESEIHQKPQPTGQNDVEKLKQQNARMREELMRRTGKMAPRTGGDWGKLKEEDPGGWG